MQKLKMLLLRISCFCILLSIACACNVLKEYGVIPLEQRVYIVPYFSNPDIDYVYKTNIIVYGNGLSGILMAKKISDTLHRVVFTTEFGNTLLDFEISETDFKINTIVNELNKKRLITILKEDFRLLFRERYTILEQKDEAYSIVYRSKEGTSYNDLFILKDKQYVFRIINSSKRKQKINVSFASEDGIYAKNVLIEHQDIKLKIMLHSFE